MQLTKAENGVNGYRWSRDGKSIAYTTSDADAKATKERAEYLGGFEVTRKEYSFAQLWTFDVAKAQSEPLTGTQRTKNKDFTIGAFEWSPDGTQIAFSATVNSDLINGGTADIYLLNLADNNVKKLVSLAGPDGDPHWSPDGKQVVFTSAMGNPKFFYSNGRLSVVSADGGSPRSLTDAFDEDPNFVEWHTDGLYFSGFERTAAHLFRIDNVSGKISRITSPDSLIAGAFSFSKDGKQMAFTSPSPTTLNELYVTSTANFAPRKLSTMTEQVKDFTLATREVISWKSKDGATIEGILIKPANFDPSKKYPLLCVIHGGPTGVDRPTLLDARYYPAAIWAAKGALVLKVNYRGSAGYGEKFRQQQMFVTLGVGDAWDVLSGVDYLIGKGGSIRRRWVPWGWSPGRIYLGVSDNIVGPFQSDLGGRRHLKLDPLLQHGYYAIHGPVPRQRPVR